MAAPCFYTVNLQTILSASIFLRTSLLITTLVGVRLSEETVAQHNTQHTNNNKTNLKAAEFAAGFAMLCSKVPQQGQGCHGSKEVLPSVL